MRRHLARTALAGLVAAGACATTAPPGTRLDEAPAPRPAQRASTPTTTLAGTLGGNSIVDRDGPQVEARAEWSQVAGSRRMRAAFTLQDDAYVLIGHVDADGVLRVVFPSDPRDDGFVRGGGRTYRSAEFFAGFTDAYAFRYATTGRLDGVRPDSYDGGGGYLFVVASWRPLHSEAIADGGRWSSFEVTNDAYVADPRPAIYELASMLAGGDADGYTVRFARYYDSGYSSSYGYSSYASHGLSLCETSFYGWSPTISWQYLSTAAPFLTAGFGQTFAYRGRRYGYDSLRQCAVALPYGYGLYAPPRIAQSPGRPGRPTSPVTGRTRSLSIDDVDRNPIEPHTPPARVAPGFASDVGGTADVTPPRVAPEYRTRRPTLGERPSDPVPRGRARVAPESQPVEPRVERRPETQTQRMEPRIERRPAAETRRTEPRVERRPEARSEPREPREAREPREPRTASPRSSEPPRSRPSPPDRTGTP